MRKDVKASVTGCGHRDTGDWVREAPGGGGRGVRRVWSFTGANRKR